jgi:hypothetical protein
VIFSITVVASSPGKARWRAASSKASVAILEAERAILEQLPHTPDEAQPLKTLCDGPPKLTRSVAQKALDSLTAQRVEHLSERIGAVLLCAPSTPE